MRLSDIILKSIGIDRKDKNKPLSEDIRDSLSKGLLDIDNIIEDVEDKIDHIEELEEDAKEALDEVDKKLGEIDIRISIIEVKIAGAVILGLLALTDYYYQNDRIYLAGVSILLVILFSLETLITLYRGFFGDFIVEWSLNVKDRLS